MALPLDVVGWSAVCDCGISDLILTGSFENPQHMFWLKDDEGGS